MTTTLFFFIMACISGLVSCIFYYRMALFLDQHGEDIDFSNIRWHMSKYQQMYKTATLERYGKIGASYYGALILFIVATLFFIASIVSKIVTL